MVPVDTRLKALQMAIDARMEGEAADVTVHRAKAFEAYLSNTTPEPPPPTDEIIRPLPMGTIGLIRKQDAG